MGIISVPRDQARWIRETLERAGIPIDHDYDDEVEVFEFSFYSRTASIAAVTALVVDDREFDYRWVGG